MRDVPLRAVLVHLDWIDRPRSPGREDRGQGGRATTSLDVDEVPDTGGPIRTAHPVLVLLQASGLRQAYGHGQGDQGHRRRQCGEDAPHTIPPSSPCCPPFGGSPEVSSLLHRNACGVQAGSRTRQGASAPRRTTMGIRPGALAQLGEHQLCKLGVAGSSPARSTRSRARFRGSGIPPLGSSPSAATSPKRADPRPGRPVSHGLQQPVAVPPMSSFVQCGPGFRMHTRAAQRLIPRCATQSRPAGISHRRGESFAWR